MFINKEKIYVKLLSILLAGLFCFRLRKIFFEQALVIELITFCFLGICFYFVLKKIYKRHIEVLDVAAVFVISLLTVLIENKIAFTQRSILRIEEISFLMVSFFSILCIKRNILRKLSLFLLIVFAIMDFIAIKVQTTHINYAFLSNIDFSIAPILFSAFLKYTIIGTVVLTLSIVLICKYEHEIRCLSVKAFKKACIPLLVFMHIAFMQEGVFYNIYSVLKASIEINFSENDNVNEILHRMGFNAELYKKKSEIIASPGKNIVVIYVESLEKNYLDDELFPGLTPNLNRLKKEWAYYDNYNQIYGTGWTVGALYTTQTGIPALFGIEGNQIFHNANGSSIVSIGAILEKAGYKTVFLTGTDPNFAGTGRLMRLNGYETMGLYDMDNAYPRSEWGVHDLDLFEEAKKKYAALSSSGMPFNLTILTVDTHFPEGLPDERLANTLNYKERKMEYTVASIDYLLNDFLAFLRKQENYKDLAIYILPDHLVMGDETVTSTVSRLKKKKRQLFLLTNQRQILNYENVNQSLTYLDMPRLILNGANVSHNAAFFNEMKQDINNSFIRNHEIEFVKLNHKFHYMNE